MKNIPVFLLPVFILLFLSFNGESLLNHPVPLLQNRTLDGKVIDAQYYKGHVTIVSFMYIGCPPCMNEINILNRIKEDYKLNEHLQMLCVARQMRDQMIDFNASNETIFSKIRNAFGADPIRYRIQPACNDTVSRMERNNSNISIKSECSSIEDVYGISAYPTILYVDEHAVVRKVEKGGPAIKNDTAFYRNIKNEIDVLLSAGK